MLGKIRWKVIWNRNKNPASKTLWHTILCWYAVITQKWLFYRQFISSLYAFRDIVRCSGVLQVGDVQRDLWARLRRRYAVGRVWTNETRTMCFYRRVHWLFSERAHSARLEMLRTWSVQHRHPWCYAASAAAVPQWHHGLPGSQLHVCTRYILHLYVVVINNIGEVESGYDEVEQVDSSR